MEMGQHPKMGLGVTIEMHLCPKMGVWGYHRDRAASQNGGGGQCYHGDAASTACALGVYKSLHQVSRGDPKAWVSHGGRSSLMAPSHPWDTVLGGAPTRERPGTPQPPSHAAFHI